MLAAMKADRNSIGIEIDPEYCQMTLKRLEREGRTLFNQPVIKFEKLEKLFRGSHMNTVEKVANTA